MHRYVTANMAGPYHLDKNIVCQDSYAVKTVGENLTVAAVADGLGSEKFSDIGSRIASETAVAYCAERYRSDMTLKEVKTLLNNSFVYAYKAVLEECDRMGEDEDEFDTTLCLAILDGRHLYFGQSGDSGMVALLSSGAYIRVTEKQNDSNGCVYPLCFGPQKWVFSELEGEVASVMLMTDGVLDKICPPVLRRDKRGGVNIPMAEMFMRREETTDEEIELFQQSLNVFLRNYPRRKLNDDKTVILIFDTEFHAEKMEESYYQIPDWTDIHKKAINRTFDRSEPEESVPDAPTQQDVPRCPDVQEMSDEAEEASGIQPPDTPPIADADVNPSDCGTEATEDDSAGKGHNASEVKDNDTPTAVESTAEAPSDTAANQPPESQERNDPAAVSSSGADAHKGTVYKHQRNQASSAEKYRIKRRSNKKKRFPAGALGMLTGALITGTALWFFSHLLLSYTSSCPAMTAFGFLSGFPNLFFRVNGASIIAESVQLRLPAAVICGSIGAVTGELLGYVIGYSGTAILKTMLRNARVKAALSGFSLQNSRHPYLIVAALSALPLPTLNAAGFLSGASRLNPLKTFAAALVGKALMMLSVFRLVQLITEALFSAV